MAKNQNLALMPNKINGVCGQIKCCIKYEHELYAEKRKRLPKENSLILANNGDKGKVLKLNLLAEEFEMITSEGKIRRYTSTQFQEENKLPVDWKMPEQFENNIVNETKELIGGKPKLDNDSEDDLHDDKHEQIQESSISKIESENSEITKVEASAENVEAPQNARPQAESSQNNKQPRQDQRPRPNHNNQRRHHQGGSQNNQNQNRRPYQGAQGNQQQGGGQGKAPGQQNSGRPQQHNNRPRPQGGRPQQRHPQQGGQNGNNNQGGGKPQG